MSLLHQNVGIYNLIDLVFGKNQSSIGTIQSIRGLHLAIDWLDIASVSRCNSISDLVNSELQYSGCLSHGHDLWVSLVDGILAVH